MTQHVQFKKQEGRCYTIISNCPLPKEETQKFVDIVSSVDPHYTNSQIALELLLQITPQFPTCRISRCQNTTIISVTKCD